MAYFPLENVNKHGYFQILSPQSILLDLSFPRMKGGNTGLQIMMIHRVKSVRIRSYSGPHFPTFGLNTERYSISLCIQSKCGKMRTKITANTENFYVVIAIYYYLERINEKVLKLHMKNFSYFEISASFF